MVRSRKRAFLQSIVFTIYITEAAELDVREAFLWYEKQRNGLGEAFREEIAKTIQTIRYQPFLFQAKYRNIRVAYPNRFPFGLHYYVHEKEKHLDIVACFHTAKNPRKWYQRG